MESETLPFKLSVLDRGTLSTEDALLMLCPLGSRSWHERMNARRLSPEQSPLARSAFDRLDSTGKGFITREDLQSFCTISRCPIDSPAFGATDKEGVGRVCFLHVVHYFYPNIAPQCLEAYMPLGRQPAPEGLALHGAVGLRLVP